MLPFGAEVATEHPAPLLRRPGWSLDGDWDFAADRRRFDRRICVPFAPESPASGIGGRDFGTVAYRRELPLERPADGGRLLLHFGAVDRVCRVLVDGGLAGGHEGGYDGFAVDITDHVGDRGTTTVVVEADDDHADLEAPRGKQDWLEDPHFIFYPPTTGIWRTVWLERVPATRIGELDWGAVVESGVVTMRARIVGPMPSGLRLRVRLRRGDRLLADVSVAALLPDVELTTPVGDGGFDDRRGLVWWPSRPVIIDAEVALLDDDGNVVDEVRSYTALRTTTVENGRFCVNGRPYALRLVLNQGYWADTGATPPSTGALRTDVELIRALGFNGARMHQKTEDPRWYAWADRLGVVAWVEMPSAQRPGALTTARLLAEWPRIVAAHRNHPSVVSWVPMNESWGTPDPVHDLRQRALIEAMTAIARAVDGRRPVLANDGWQTVGGDIVGVHDYSRDSDRIAGRYATAADVDDVLANGLVSLQPFGTRIDLDRVPAGERAVMLTEFGGISFDDGSDDWKYQAVRTPEELVDRYRDLWAAVHASDRLAGACWTQLTDTYQEANGLLRMDRTPKAPVEDLAAATRGSSTARGS